MIHIDRNNTKQDIILQNDKIISWEDHFDQDPFIAHLDTTQHHPGPVETTHDSPTSTRGRSSSLSPVPDPSPQPQEKEAPLQIPVREEEEEDENENEAVPTAINEASRLSTPLSELSPPPDQDEAPDADTQKPSSSPKSDVPADTNDTQPTTTTDVGKSEATKEDPGDGSSNTSQPALTAPGVSSPSSPPQPSQTAVQEPSDQTSPTTSPPSPEKAGPSMPSHSPTNINGTSLSPTSTSSTPNFIQQAQDAALLNPSPGDPKVELVLELNLELLKILIALQGKGVSPSDARFQQYAQRIQSNLGWMASSADYHRLGGQIVQAQTSQGKHSKGPIHPIIEPPAFIEFGSDRIQQIYSELPKTFSKEINLRQQLAATTNIAVPANPLHSMVPGNLKRDRPDEPISEVMSSKRRDTGEGKMRPPSLSPSSHSASGMMPPPSSIPQQQQQQLNPNHGVTLPAATHFSLPISTSNTNGVSGNIIPPQLQQQQGGGGGGMGIDPSVGMMNTSDIQRAAARERERLQQQRLAQQASRQLSPQSSQPQPGSIPNVSANAAAGPSSGGGGGGGGDLPPAIAALPQPMQQAYRILNTPNHPYIKYMMQNLPGFHTMPLQLQLNKMVSFQTRLQQQREQTHREQMARAMASGGAGGGGRGGMNPQQQLGDNMAVQQGTQFPVTPASPVHASQNPMFAGQGGGGGGGMDPRMGGINMNNLTPQQRHMLLMQQQQRNNSGGGGGGGNQGGMNMNSMQMNQISVNPQLHAFQEQQRMRMAQERMGLAGANNAAGGISPTSPDPGAFRSNSTIPGIARSARSPTDASMSISPVHNQTQTSRGGNMGMTQDDYQRMMMQQQQGQAQAVRAMAQSPAFGQQQGWGQQQQQERQQQQQLQQQQQFGMSPPGSAVGAPSPPNSQNWNGAQYPFSSSSPVGGGGGGIGEMQQIRHLSATPAPQQQQRQMTPQNTTSPPTAENEADWFNWQ